MKKGIILILMILLLSATSLFAQNLNISGVVVDFKSGEPLIGATVIQKGTNNGTVTDLDGKFTLVIPKETTLSISYIGYVSQETVIKNNNQIKTV